MKRQHSLLSNKIAISIAVVSIFCLLVVVEFSGRIVGLHNPPLYIGSPEFDYIYAPNQDLWRFGRHIITNEYSMRSFPLSEDDYIRILLLGDSIINGGAEISHNELATTLLEDSLSARFRKKIRVLNCATGGWGPDNEFEYIKKYNHFNASLIVWVVSSHDIHINSTHNIVIGDSPYMPGKKPLCAISELFKRYLIPRASIFLAKVIEHHNNPTVETTFCDTGVPGQFVRNPGFDSLSAYASRNNLQIKAWVHPTRTEVGRQAYDLRGQAILLFLDSVKIPYQLEISNNPRSAFYLDDIHYTKEGQRFLFNEMYSDLEHFISDKLAADTLVTRT